MAGIAIIVKDMSFSESNLGQVTFAGQTIPITAIGISNVSTNVPLNASSISLSAVYTPSNTTQKGVTWSITSGGTYASINQNGVVTLHNLVANAQFTVKVESTADASINATKTFTVVSSNMMTTIKSGKKFNTSTGVWDDNSDYISCDWIDVLNVDMVTLTMPCSVSIDNQTGSTNKTINARIGIVYEDMSGDFHTLYWTNNLIPTTYSGSNTYPFNIPTRIMKRMHIFSLVDGSTASNTNSVIQYKLTDWQNGTIVVHTMTSNSKTYDNTFLMDSMYAGSSLSGGFMRNTGTAFRAFALTMKSGDSLSLTTKGGSSAKAYNIYKSSDGTVISQAAASADYTETPFTYTATEDVIVTGSCANAAYEVFTVSVTRS